MNRSGFKPRKPTRGAKRPLGRDKKQKAPRVRKVKNKGYKVPSWFKSIKPGAHGQSPSQKRLWRVVSEFVRKRDFEKYGKCVSCGYRFSCWEESQAGHWLPYSLCNSFYKFDPTFNIAGQCSACNTSLHRSGAHVGHEMGEELKRRYGSGVLEIIKEDNRRFHGMKLEVWNLVDMASRVNPDLVK